MPFESAMLCCQVLLRPNMWYMHDHGISMRSLVVLEVARLPSGQKRGRSAKYYPQVVINVIAGSMSGGKSNDLTNHLVRISCFNLYLVDIYVVL